MQSGCALNPWAMGRRNAKEVAKLMGYNADMDEKTFLEKFRKVSARSIVKAQFKMVDVSKPNLALQTTIVFSYFPFFQGCLRYYESLYY